MNEFSTRLIILITTLRHLVRNAVLPSVTPNLSAKACAEISMGSDYFHRAFSRLNNLYIRCWKAGKYRYRAPKPRPQQATPRPRKPGLPRARLWFVRHSGMLRNSAAILRSWMLQEPELSGFVEAVPTAKRILRPLCTLLMMEIPENIALPPKPRREPKPRAPKPPKPPRETKYWKPHTGPYPGVPDRHRLKIPGINAPRLPEDRKRKKA